MLLVIRASARPAVLTSRIRKVSRIRENHAYLSGTRVCAGELDEIKEVVDVDTLETEHRPRQHFPILA